MEKKEDSCCDSGNSCCNPSGCMVISEEKIESTEIPKKQLNPNKLTVDIYVPMDACACEWSQFMNLIFNVLTPHIKHIKHETKNLNSEEAQNLGLHGKCIVIDGEKKYTTSFALKRDLPKLLEEKGLV